ncbi:hypothetical protein GCM10023183_14200 [Nibribacter koreensis]|uniref:Por secretion system C-terminal sorting domain-containing protein n=1 Tax=Nibribacter koreensis TaxID=1084519 RepID=A0ABP8FFD4_9BACT
MRGAITPLVIVGEVTIGNKVYDKTTAASIIDRSLVGNLNGDAVFYTGGTATFSDENVGTGKTVTVTGLGLSGADAGNYTVNTTATATADITKRAIVLTVNAQNKVYDGNTNATVTFTTNIIPGDNLSVAHTSADFADKSANTHQVTVSGITFVGTDQDNYAIPTGGTATGSATITKKPLTLANASANNKVYDRTNAAVISGDLEGIVGGDEVTVNHAGVFASINVGTGIAVSVVSTLGGADAGNYTIAQPAGLNANITPKAITIQNAVALGKVYNASRATTITGTLAGVISPDNVTFVGKGVFQSSEVGLRDVTSEITLGGTSAGNYLLQQPTGLTATITPKPITVSSAIAQSKVYDGSVAATVTGSLSGVESEDAGNVTLQLAATFNDKNVGTSKPITPNATLTGAKAINYSVTQPGGLTANITPKGLTVSGVTAVSRVYDRTTSASLQGTPSLSGVVQNDVVNFNPALLTATFDTKTVGVDKAVTVTGNALTGTDAGNYTFAAITGLKATITAKPVTIAGAGASNKTYDGLTSATLLGNLNGVITDDVVSLTRVANFATANAGNGISVSSTSTLTGADALNYALTQPTGITANILPKGLTISNALAQSKVYDKTNAATISGTLSGIVGTDQVSFTPTGTFASVNAGTWDVTFTGSLAGAKALNYTLTNPTGLRATINPKALTVSNAKALDKIYDRTTAAIIEGTLNGVLAGDEVTWSGAGTFASARVNRNNHNDPVDPIAVSYNNASLKGAQAGNYTFSFTPPGLSAKILPKVVTPIIEAFYTIEYGSTINLTISNQSLTGVISPDFVSLYITFDLSNVNVGSYEDVKLLLSIGSTDKNNYDLVPNIAYAGVKVTARPLVISAAGVNKVYDGSDLAFINLSDNRVAGDDLTVTYTSAKFNDKHVGVNKPISIAGLAISGTKAANYVLSNPVVSASANITKRPLTITGITANEKPYDGVANVLGFTGTATLDGMIPNDAVALVGQPSGMCDSKDAGDRIVTLSGLTHAGADAGNYLFSLPMGMRMKINPKSVIGSFVAEDKLWDGTTAATISSVTINDRITGDDVSFEGVARFLDADMGVQKPVVFDMTTAKLIGLQRANYILVSINNAAANIVNPLPVTMVSFTAKAQKGKVLLSWTTATEINNEYFQIERSEDGRNFTTLGKVKGNGNSNMLLNYTYQDLSPLTGTAYYRLKQVDFDGKFEYSKVVSTQMKASTSAAIAVKAYPNPTSDVLILDLAHLSDAPIQVQVMDLNGHVLQARELQGGKLQTLDLSTLTGGSYLLKVIGKEVNTHLRIVKR